MDFTEWQQEQNKERGRPAVLDYSGPTYDESGRGGRGPDVAYTPGDRVGHVVPGSSPYDKDVQRYRRMGAAAYMRDAPTVATEHTNTGRNLQMGSLGMIAAAAHGRGPSIAGTEAIRAGQSLASSVRGGPGARIAAMRGATQQAGSQYAMARAKEMADARGQYFGAATGMRGQDIDLAKAQADAIARQRTLGAQERQAYEQLGEGVYKQEQDRYALRTNQYKAQNEAKPQQEQWGIMDDLSDARAKENIRPMGSLATLFHR